MKYIKHLKIVAIMSELHSTNYDKIKKVIFNSSTVYSEIVHIVHLWLIHYIKERHQIIRLKMKLAII